MRKRKGALEFADVTFGTLLVFVVVILAVAVGLLGFLSIQVKGIGKDTSPLSSSDFLEMNTRAFMLANVFTNLRAEDRNVLEHAEEITATGSVVNASSQNFALYLDAFLNFYKTDQNDNFYVAVRKDGNDIFTYSRLDVKCGDNFEGYCALPEVNINTYYIGCGAGRKVIDANSYTRDSNKCPAPRQLCCIEDTDANGVWVDPNIRTCGFPLNGVKPGVCDKNLKVGYSKGQCNGGRILIEDNGDCDPLNTYPPDAYVCCAPLTNLEAATELGLVSTAEIPILYKSDFAVLEVSTT